MPWEVNTEDEGSAEKEGADEDKPLPQCSDEVSCGQDLFAGLNLSLKLLVGRILVAEEKVRGGRRRRGRDDRRVQGGCWKRRSGEDSAE